MNYGHRFSSLEDDPRRVKVNCRIRLGSGMGEEYYGDQSAFLGMWKLSSCPPFVISIVVSLVI